MVSRRARERGWMRTIHPSGAHNAVTDVPGVRVGHAGLVASEGEAHTGVTVLDLPGRDRWRCRYFAGSAVVNGFGLMTGRDAVDSQGMITGPIVLTGTRSVGAVYDAVVARSLAEDREAVANDLPLPVVGECDDGYLSSPDLVCGPETVEAAFQALGSGPVDEGGVGAGAGMHLFGYKGGIGTASRLVSWDAGTCIVGVLLLTNFGRPEDLRLPWGLSAPPGPDADPRPGSCIGVVVTDAPLHPHQLQRVAARVGFGLARTGSIGRSGSGELALAVSTHSLDDSGCAPAPAGFVADRPLGRAPVMDLLYGATVDATEEAVWNALLAAQTREGPQGRRLVAFSDRHPDLAWAPEWVRG